MTSKEGEPRNVICKDAVLEGETQFGNGNVVHPKAIIRATSGPIHIGDNNIIEETAIIENLGPEGHVLEIGSDNVFEVGCVCRALRVGSNNIVSVRAYVGEGVTVSDGCQVGIACTVEARETLPPLTVVYGENNERLTAHEPPPSQHSHLEALRKNLPRYNHLLKKT